MVWSPSSSQSVGRRVVAYFLSPSMHHQHGSGRCHSMLRRRRNASRMTLWRWRIASGVALWLALPVCMGGSTEGSREWIQNPHCADDKCLSLFRVTLGCIMDGNISCGECLPGFVGPESASAPCVANTEEEYPFDGQYEDDSVDEEPSDDHHAMGMRESLGTAMGSLLVFIMCLVSWNGWVDCCSNARKVNRHRAFIISTTNDWECTTCLHENSALRHYCVLCGTEMADAIIATPHDDTSVKDGNAYTLVETPRGLTRSLRRRHFHSSSQTSESRRRAIERLEWKRYITKDGVQWLRFKAEDVRRYRHLRGTFFTNQRRRYSGLQREQATPPSVPADGYFVRVDNQAVVEWIAVDQATRDPRMYKHWRRLPKAAAQSFHDRLQWLYQELLQLRDPLTRATYTLHVSRVNVLAESMDKLMAIAPSTLRREFRVHFTDEPGVDGGGILREWLHVVCQQLFAESTGLFQRVQSPHENSSYWIKPAPQHQLSYVHQQMYTFTGKVLGKAILEGLVLNVRLSTPLLKHLFGYPLSLADVRSIDEQIHASIEYILTHDGIDQLSLTFAVAGHDLIKSGADIAVTDSNKQLYVDQLVRYYLFDSISEQLRCIFVGLRSVLPDKLLHVLDFRELDLVLSGLPEIDVLDWQAHSVVNLVGRRPEIERRVVDWFWEVVATMDPRQRGRLIQFVTGSSGVPVEGFQALTSADGRLQPFTIQLSDSGGPYASTCFNRLDLPVYESKQELQDMLHLLVAMDVTGFNRR